MEMKLYHFNGDNKAIYDVENASAENLEKVWETVADWPGTKLISINTTIVKCTSRLSPKE